MQAGVDGPSKILHILMFAPHDLRRLGDIVTFEHREESALLAKTVAFGLVELGEINPDRRTVFRGLSKLFADCAVWFEQCSARITLDLFCSSWNLVTG